MKLRNLQITPSKRITNLLMIMCICMILFLSILLTYFSYQNNLNEGRLSFSLLAQENEDALLDKLSAYEQALLGGAGFFQGSKQVSQEEWTLYVNALDIDKNLPGISGIGYIKNVNKSMIHDYIQEQRKHNHPQFTIHPKTINKPYFIIQYIIPLQPNLAALGLNIAFEKNRYEAAILSQNSHQSAITKRIHLAQDKNKTPGFLLLHPFYHNKTNQFRGWIYAPFIAQKLMNNLTQSQEKLLTLSVYDEGLLSPNSLIYSNESTNEPSQSLFKIVKKLRIYQQTWLIVWKSRPAFDAKVTNWQPCLILLTGFLFAGALSLFFITLQRRSKMVEHLVDKKTKESYATAEQLKLLIKNTPAAVAMFDTNMRYILCSDRWKRDYHLGDTLIIGKSHYDIFPEILKMPEWLNYHSKALKGEIVSKEEDYWLRKNKHHEWVKWAIHPWKNENGEIGGIVMFTEVITQRKEAEIRSNILRNIMAEATLGSSILEAITNCIQIICKQLNWAIGHAFFYDKGLKQLVSLDIWCVLHSQNKHQEFQKISNKITFKSGQGLPGRVYQSEKTIFIQDVSTDKNFPRNKLLKQLFLHSAIGIPIFIKNEVTFVLEFFDEQNIPQNTQMLNFYDLLSTQISRVIERKYIEIELEKSATLNKAVLDSAAYLIIATEPDGIVLVFNHAAEIALGYSANDVIGKKTPAIWHDFDEVIQRTKDINQEYHTDLTPGFQTFVYRSKIEGTESKEWTFIRKNGTRFPGQLTVTPLKNPNGVILGFLGIIEDITAKKEIDQIKSEFISLVSHELRTPLTAIRGALSMLNELTRQALTDKSKRILEIANKNADRLLLLINDILDIDKISLGKMQFYLRRECIQALVKQSVEINQTFADKFQVHLKVKAPKEPYYVDVDPNRLNQIFSNLISNAIKFSPKNSTVLIKIEKINQSVQVSFHDNGSGIPQKYHDRIFKKFSQINSPKSRTVGGTGLGLYICKQFIEKMNGSIHFRSEPEVGTTFWIELPVASK